MALTQTQVSELYVSLLGRASEGQGNQWWMANYDDQTIAADAMLGSQAVADYFGDAIHDDDDFVAHIYKNTLNKTADGSDGTVADPAGLAYWEGRLDGTTGPILTRAEMITTMITEINRIQSSNPSDASKQFTNRVEVSDYTANVVYEKPADYKVDLAFHNSGVIADPGLVVNETPASVVGAKSEIDGFANTDPDLPHEFTLTADADSVLEGAALSYTVTANRAVDKDTVVTFEVVAGDQAAADQGTSNTNLNDFIESTFNPLAVTIPAGQTTAAFSVAGDNDGLTELPEAYTVNAVVNGETLTVATTLLDGGASETFVLTTGMDTIAASSPTAADVVKGIINDDGTNDNSTFSVADTIAGNGQTELSLTVVDTDGTYAASFVEMDGVDAINIKNAGGTGLDLNAATYGSDISSLTMNGADGLDVNIENLTVKGALAVSVAAGTEGRIVAAGEMDGLYYSADVSNFYDGTTSSMDVSAAAINLVAGDNGDVDFYLAQTAEKAAAAVAVGDLDIGDVSLIAGRSGEFDLSVSNYADNSGTGTAAAGDLTIGDVTMVIGESATNNFLSAYNAATAVAGAATAGNLTVGNIDVAIAQGGELDNLTWANEADSHKGDATVGNMTVGDINLVAAGGIDHYAYFTQYQYASADISGDAVVGNMTIGNITMSAGDDAQSMDFYSENVAYAEKGNAVVGNTLVGNVKMTAGNEVDSSVDLTFSASQSASVTGTGDATVGSITIGSVDMTVGTSGDASLTVENHADANNGAATVGAVTVGDINAAIGAGGVFSASITADAQGTAGDSVGNLTVGDVTLFGAHDASLDFYLQAIAENGDVSDVNLGDVSMKLDDNGELDLSIDIVAGKNIGDVSIGNIDLILGGTSASIDTFSISVTAWSGDIASFSIGDISIKGAAGSWDDSREFDVYAANDIGDITIGDVIVDAGVGANFDSGTFEFSAANGSMANVSMGDVTLTAAVSADIFQSFSFSAADEIGNVTVGDITLSAAENAHITLNHGVGNDDDIGTIEYGDISLAATGDHASIAASITAGNFGSSDIGAITIGDIDLTASDLDASVQLSMTYSADTTGLVTVGDIDVSVTNDAAAANFAAAHLTIDLYGGTGDLLVGDISMSTAGQAADYAGIAKVIGDVALSSDDDLTVGDILVVGGYTTTNPLLAPAQGVLDNFAVLTSWLDLNAGGDITVGDIDYSGYKAEALIDASWYKSAADITAAQDDTFIYDTKDKNVITLGAGDDTVVLDVDATTDETDETAIDEIVNFTHAADLIVVDLDASDFVWSSTGTSYADFLTDAAASMQNFSTDVFAQKVGGDTYVAFDKDANGVMDFAIELTGVTLVDSGDFNIV